MSKIPHLPQSTIHQTQDNNHSNSQLTELQHAKAFIAWYKHMIDDERQNLCLYLSDDAILQWFGRTIKTRKKVSAFLKYNMQCSRHDFTTVESIDKIEMRQDRSFSNNDTTLVSPINTPEDKDIKRGRFAKRNLRMACHSPEWAEGCKPNDEIKELDTIIKSHHIEHQDVVQKQEGAEHQRNVLKREYTGDEGLDMNSKGDGMLGRRIKRRCVPVTPPNCEVGQGDCLPSTSGTDSDRSHDTLNAQLPKLAVQCNGYIEFTRSRNNRSADSMKWDRKCKIQISYSQDPLNIGEYIIWALIYTDESKCRRNLLAAFEEAAKEDDLV
ncbi:uncharacterized protein ACR2FA_012795 [Aphomia sociella]